MGPETLIDPALFGDWVKHRRLFQLGEFGLRGSARLQSLLAVVDRVGTKLVPHLLLRRRCTDSGRNLPEMLPYLCRAIITLLALG